MYRTSIGVLAVCALLGNHRALAQATWPASQPVDVTAGDPSAVRITFRAPSAAGPRDEYAIAILPRELREQRAALGNQPATVALRFSVVYLLHGYDADYTRWYMRAKEAGISLAALADRYQVILVMPNGRRASWYLDAPSDVSNAPDWQLETEITRSLIPEVDRRFPTWAEPAGRGLTGMSMGGHGALYLAARHPDLFGACATMSGIMDLTQSLNKQPLGLRLGSIEEHRDRWIEHSVITQAGKFVGQKTAIMMDCGWDDPFFQGNRALHARLMELKVPHDYVERPGAHTWEYWLNALPFHLQFLTDHLRPAGEPARAAEALTFKTVVVDQKLPDDPYGIDIADMNHDGRPDIVLIRFTSVVWYENPNWTRHVVVTSGTKDNVSGGVCDVDGDGELDIAVGCDWKFEDTTLNGNVWWGKNTPGDNPWPLVHIDGEPNIHRIRWVDVDGDKFKELLVAPLKGIETTAPNFAERGARLYLLRIPQRPATDHWLREMIDSDLHVLHGAVAVQFDPDPPQEILTASFEGVHLFKRSPTGAWSKTHLCEGEQKTSPNRGSSEVALGKFHDGRRIIATIEPWHGHEVVVYVEPPTKTLWKRYLLDDTFDQGHGLACVDLDGDGDDEIVAGYRGANHDGRRPTSLKAYRPVDPEHGKWQTQWLDEGNMATEDLKVADMNGDGRPDVVSCGRSTRNLKVYLNQNKR